MKRMHLIAITFGLLVLIIVGTVPALASPEPVKFRSNKHVVTYEDDVVGWIIVNPSTWWYVLNVRGLAPNTEYWLICEGRPGVIASATTRLNGALSIHGILNPAPDMREARFYLGTGSPPPTSGVVELDGKECKGSWFTTQIFGTLTSGGAPMTGKTVNIYTYDSYKQEIEGNAGSATTDSNGKFCKVLGGGHAGYSIVIESEGIWDMNVEKVTTCPVC